MAALVISGIAFSRYSAAASHGAWDAWGDWNLRARFLYRLLQTSLTRLCIQLYPSALFLLFLLARTPEEALNQASP